MAKEMETTRGSSEPIEILPEDIGTLPALETAPLLARASSRIHTLGLTGEFWNGVRQNLEGAATWIKAEKANLVKKTLSVVTGISFLTATVSACNINPDNYTPSAGPEGPRSSEVSPTETFTSSPTDTPTSTDTTTPTPTETPTITASPTPEGTVMPFDISKPETITVTDGKTYEGYYIEDDFGTRLVDELNNIILIKDGETWRVPESLNYSSEYPAVFYETKIGEADGFSIPITIGLAQNAKEGVRFVFREVHITQIGADDLAAYYLFTAWERYNLVMKHPNVTYGEYLNLLARGKGNIEIIDSVTKKPVLIDPRQGFSVVLTGDETGKMPLKSYDYPGFYFGGDESGRLMFAINSAWGYHTSVGINKNPHIRNDNTLYLLSTFFQIGMIAIYPSSCMLNEMLIPSWCKTPEEPDDMTETFRNLKLVSDYADYNSYKTDDPLFVLK